MYLIWILVAGCHGSEGETLEGAGHDRDRRYDVYERILHAANARISLEHGEIGVKR